MLSDTVTISPVSAPSLEPWPIDDTVASIVGEALVKDSIVMTTATVISINSVLSLGSKVVMVEEARQMTAFVLAIT
jgi:uncharacterized protein YrrD